MGNYKKSIFFSSFDWCPIGPTGDEKGTKIDGFTHFAKFLSAMKSWTQLKHSQRVPRVRILVQVKDILVDLFISMI